MALSTSLAQVPCSLFPGTSMGWGSVMCEIGSNWNSSKDYDVQMKYMGESVALASCRRDRDYVELCTPKIPGLGINSDYLDPILNMDFNMFPNINENIKSMMDRVAAGNLFDQFTLQEAYPRIRAYDSKQDLSGDNIFGSQRRLLDPPVSSDPVRHYDYTLSTLLDEHAPAKTKLIVDRASAPWITAEDEWLSCDDSDIIRRTPEYIFCDFDPLRKYAAELYVLRHTVNRTSTAVALCPPVEDGQNCTVNDSRAFVSNHGPNSFLVKMPNLTQEDAGKFECVSVPETGDATKDKCLTLEASNVNVVAEEPHENATANPPLTTIVDKEAGDQLNKHKAPINAASVWACVSFLMYFMMAVICKMNKSCRAGQAPSIPETEAMVNKSCRAGQAPSIPETEAMV